MENGFGLPIEKVGDFVLITINGKFCGMTYESHRNYYTEADAVQEFMSDVMKNEEHRKGIWVWYITKNASEIEGKFLGKDFDSWLNLK